MTLRTACRRTALGLVLLCAGCTTVSHGRDSLLSRVTSSRADRSEPESTDASENSSPVESRDPPAESSPLTAAEQRRPIDAATQLLIETELKDCTPSERQQWMAYLQGVDPAIIPHILQARRMQAEQGSNADRTAAPSYAQSRESTLESLPAVAPAGHSALVHASVPRLEFEAADEPFDPDAALARGTGPSAPEPGAITPVAGGISPFRRAGESAETEVQAGYEAFFTGRETASQPDVDAFTGETLPAISPNQPGAIPDSLIPPGTGTTEDAHEFGSSPAAVSESNPPLSSTTLEGAYWQETLQRLTALVEAEVATGQPQLAEPERTQYIKRHVWLRMLYLMGEQPQLAQQAIPGLNPAEQEFWTALFWAVSNYFDTQSAADPAERAALTLEQLDYAQGRLESLAALQLRNVSFCYKINSFGNFESWQRDEFRPGQTVLLYAEVRNFESRPTPEGQFTTNLKSSIEIRRGNSDGEVIEQNSLPVTQDVCRSRRHDYFHSYTIDLPQNLAPGPYTLILRVEDLYSGKSAREAIGFLIR